MRSYRREDLPHDLIAGAVVGMLTVPQAVAYALLAGLPAEAGLYACLAPMVIHALLSSSRQLIVGPVAIAALMVASTISQHAPAYPEAYLDIAMVLSLQVGLVLWLLRLLQVGGIVNLLSHPVVSGFVNGAAILIIVSQLQAFTGVGRITTSFGDGALSHAAALVGSLAEIKWPALALGTASLLLMAVVRRGTPALLGRWRREGSEVRGSHALTRTGPVLAVVLTTVAVALLDLKVDVVGTFPGGLPALTVPVLDAQLWLDVAPNAVLIALVAFVESYSVGRTLASRQRQRIDSHQELLALGAANIGAALSGAYPVAGSFSRSSLNYASGARSPVAALVCAVLIVATLLWLTPLFALLPKAALAAVVIAAVFELTDFRSVRRDWRFYRPDTVTHFATFAGVLVLGVEAGLVIGVGVSIVLFMRGSARPHIAVVGRLGDTPHFRNVERYPVRTWPNLLAVRIDESFYFANADTVESRLAELLDAPEPDDVEHLLIVMSAVNFIDTTGLEMLERLTDRLQRRGVVLDLCEVKGPVRDQLEHVALKDWLTGEVFQTTDDAFNALTDAEGRWVWREHET
ncbi:MAG: sulfate permease [Pseudomonadales bacterium]|nr:sulfate permease [Pseudomonadales bacterium]